MYMAAREKEGDVRTAASKCYLMLLRAVLAAARGGSAAAAALAEAQQAAIVAEVFDKKKTHWGLAAASDAVKQCALAAALLPALLDKAASARTEFLRTEALQLCALCLRAAGPQRAEVLAAAGSAMPAFVKALAKVAPGGFSKPPRWADALKQAASCLEGLHALHAKAEAAAFLGADGAKQLRAAVRHGLSADDLPPKCATQLQRMKKVLEAKGAAAAGASVPAPAKAKGAKEARAPGSADKSPAKRKAAAALGGVKKAKKAPAATPEAVQA